eukprot:7882775-Alexandrium_andersonii.AAC.1
MRCAPGRVRPVAGCAPLSTTVAVSTRSASASSPPGAAVSAAIATSVHGSGLRPCSCPVGGGGFFCLLV